MSTMDKSQQIFSVFLFGYLSVLLWILLNDAEENVSHFDVGGSTTSSSNGKSNSFRLHSDRRIEFNNIESCILKDTDLHYNYFNRHGINIACSSEIPLNRTVVDTRDPECIHKTYPEKLPKTSIIIVFQHAVWTILMRTIYSIKEKTSNNLIEEIILIDDSDDEPDVVSNSDFEDFNINIKIIKNKHKGLIHARMLGVKEAHTETIVFLNAYCEVNINWLPPLLEPILKDRTTLTEPIVDYINPKSFDYWFGSEPDICYKGLFNWDMKYQEVSFRPGNEAHKCTTEPYSSLIHAGGIIAVNKHFFLELGGYDLGLYDAQGENLELSFKYWMCGGNIKRVPCSRVGAIFGNQPPPPRSANLGRELERMLVFNRKRIVETWFDERHKKYFYIRMSVASSPFFKIGDISDILEMKRRMECKSFHWFMNSLAYEVRRRYPPPSADLHVGYLFHKQSGKCAGICDSCPPNGLRMVPCKTITLKTLGRLTTRGRLEIGERCVDAHNNDLVIVPCTWSNGPWKYQKSVYSEAFHLFHYEAKKCMVHDNISMHIQLDLCTKGEEWEFEEYPIF